MPNKIQIKRTSVTGRTPNTTSSGNSSFIDTGELALNITDGKLFSSDGTNYIEVGANLNSLSVGGAKLTANSTLVNAVALNVVNQTNTATLYVTTSANVGTNVQITTNSFRLGNASSNVNITNTSITHLSNNAFNPQVVVRNSNNDEFGPYWNTGKSRAGAAVQNNDDLGTFMFQGHDGTDFRNTAYIVTEVDGTVSTSNVPSKLLFFNTNTSGNLLNRLTIFANGNVNINNGIVTVGGGVATTTGTTVTNTSITVGNTATNSSLGVSTLNVSTTFTVNSISVNSTVNTSILAIIANGSIGTAGQVLTSNATGIYWSTVSGGGSATKFSANIGNGSATSITVNHNLNSDNVFVTVIENSTGYYVYPDIKYSTSNSTIFEFVDAPTTNQYKVIVL
jgi:hypothetical protein